MSEEDRQKEKKEESGEVSRREFLKDAGFVVGGAAVGAAIAWPLLPKEEKIVEVPGETVYVDVPGPEVKTFVDPFNHEFDTFAELVAHMETAHPGETTTIEVFNCPYDTQTFNTVAALGVHLDAVHGGREKTPGEVVAAEGQVTLTVNGGEFLVKVEDNWTLAYVLREKLGLTGTKRGCDVGDSCGVCTVEMAGRPVLSCIVLAVEAEGKAILTIEGLAKSSSELHPVQQAFIDKDGLQCGFCTPGQIMTAKTLLDFNPNPTEAEVREWMAGVLCRCGAYQNMREAVLAAAG